MLSRVTKWFRRTWKKESLSRTGVSSDGLGVPSFDVLDADSSLDLATLAPSGADAVVDDELLAVALGAAMAGVEACCVEAAIAKRMSPQRSDDQLRSRYSRMAAGWATMLRAEKVWR